MRWLSRLLLPLRKRDPEQSALRWALRQARVRAKRRTAKAPVLARLALKLEVTSMTDKLTPAEKRKSGRKGDGWN